MREIFMSGSTRGGGGIRNFVFEAYLSEEEEICRRTEGMSMMGRKIG
jgi:hypothetical protein